MNSGEVNMVAEIANMQEHLQQKWIVFWFALSAGLWALAIAWRRGFFKSLPFSPYPHIRGIDVLKGFGLFLFIEVLLIPGLIGTIALMAEIDLQKDLQVYPQIKGWINLLIIIGGFGGISFAYFSLPPLQRHQLWHQTTTPSYVHIGMGIVAWFISYPVVLAFSEGVSLILWHFFQHSFVEQIAVQNVRNTMMSPVLFGLTTISIVTLVPLTEEFLFRALLQSWLKGRFQNAGIAIVISSFIFALFHYSKFHGITNVELLSSLFLLSCMLGYLFERQGSLLAPVTLHGFFNLMSLFMLTQEGGS